MLSRWLHKSWAYVCMFRASLKIIYNYLITCYGHCIQYGLWACALYIINSASLKIIYNYLIICYGHCIQYGLWACTLYINSYVVVVIFIIIIIHNRIRIRITIQCVTYILHNDNGIIDA